MKRLFNLYTLSAIVAAFLMFSCAATKTAKVNPYVGDWAYTAETPNGNLDVVMTINEAEGVYSGTLSTDMGSGDLSDLKIDDDGKMTATFDYQGYTIQMKGTFDGDVFTGSSSVDTYEMPINAIRKKTE
jgi:hypothetical protein